MIQSNFAKKSNKKNTPSLSPTFSKKPEIREIKSITPDFTPKSHLPWFLSDPEIIYDLAGKNLEKTQNEFEKICVKHKLRKKEIVKEVKGIKKNCKTLTSLMIKDAMNGQEELQEIILHEERKHPKNAEFFKEVKGNNVFAVQTLLILHPELVREMDSTMQTGLHWAVKRNYMKLTKCLLNSGANPRIKDFAGRAVEKIARKNGNTEIIKILTGAERRSALDLSKNVEIEKSRSYQQYTQLVGLKSRSVVKRK